VVICAARLADLDAVWAIEREVFGTDIYPRFFFRQAYDVWGELLRVAEADSGELAGYALGAVGVEAGEAWILSAAVLPEQRGQGIATQLTRDLLDVLRRRGVYSVRLTVHPQNHGAIRIYQRLGFQTIGREEDYYGPGDPRLIMRLELSATHLP
jgi:ribosomal protein S18 acetylase RimI-like enzyme